MNREIKFRAWDGEQWTLFTLELGNDGFINLPPIPAVGKPFKFINQGTGLKDKNDVEIYEGDIVSRTRVSLTGTFEEKVEASKKVISTSEVRFDNEELCYMIEENSWPGVYNGWGCIEVVGNIYQNPELIK